MADIDPAARLAVTLDRLIHERIRLGVIVALSGGTTHTFAELRQGLGVTEGNLSEHLRRLELDGYVKCDKSFEGRLPRSDYRLTAAGKKAAARYWDGIHALARAAQPRQKAGRKPSA